MAKWYLEKAFFTIEDEGEKSTVIHEPCTINFLEKILQRFFFPNQSSILQTLSDSFSSVFFVGIIAIYDRK